MVYKFKDDWDTLTRINFLQRRIIVASIAYYEFDVSIITDYKYDAIVRQLKEIMCNCTESEKEQSRYWYVFKDWDGSTGYFLYYNLNDTDREMLTVISSHIIFNMSACKEGDQL